MFISKHYYSKQHQSPILFCFNQMVSTVANRINNVYRFFIKKIVQTGDFIFLLDASRGVRDVVMSVSLFICIF